MTLASNPIASNIAFEPTRTAGLAQLQRFVQESRAGAAYERDRNFDRTGLTGHDAARLAGNVSYLSPYIRHRLVTEAETLRATLEHENPAAAEKFVQEVCWRTYWKGWLERNPNVWHRYCYERDQLASLNPAMLKAIRRAQQAATGIECFDAWVEQLVDTGYLHNHSRMWFASIWIFTLNLPWQAGADFFMQHLCDADAASNTLSWRWVAGLHTRGKHYLARADNIARYTAGRFNPRGQLNEEATALNEEEAPRAPWLESSENQPSWNAGATTSLTAGPVPPHAFLLIHEDDLYPESFAQLPTISGLIVVNSGAHRSSQPLGEVSQQFVNGALLDARQRAMAHWKLSESQVIDCASPQALAHMLEGRPSIAPVVTPWIPVGPTRDALQTQLTKLAQRGVTTRYIARRWDVAAWPFANKGFFQFKTKIPDLLRTAL
jgi:deoxyribodipyrimidine photo-lyase